MRFQHFTCNQIGDGRETVLKNHDLPSLETCLSQHTVLRVQRLDDFIFHYTCLLWTRLNSASAGMGSEQL